MANPEAPQRILVFTMVGILLTLIVLAVFAAQYHRDVTSSFKTIQDKEESQRGQSGIEKQLETLKKEYADLNVLLQGAKKDRETAESGITEEKRKLEARAVKAETDLAAVKKDLDALTAADAKAKEELQAAKKSQADTSGQLLGIQKDSEAKLQKAQADMATQVQNLQKDADTKLAAAKKESDDKIGVLQKDSETKLTTARAEAEAKLAAAKKDRDNAETVLQDEKKKQETRATKAETDLAALKKDYDALVVADAKVKEDLLGMKQDRAFLQQEMKNLRSDLETWGADLGLRLRSSSEEALKASSEVSATALGEVQGRFDSTDESLRSGNARLDASLARSDALAAEVSKLYQELASASRTLAALKAGQDGSQAKTAEMSRQIAALVSVISKDQKALASTSARPERPVPVAELAGPPEAPAVPKSAAGPSDEDIVAAVIRNERPPRQAKSEADTPPARLLRIEAKVELVQDRYLVLTSGLKAGVKEGREFEIRRDDLRIAVAQVTRVTEDYSGARIVSIENGKEVRPGDLAVAEAR